MRYRTVGICLVCLAVMTSAEQAFAVSPARESPEVKALNRVIPSTVSLFTYNHNRDGDSPKKGMGTGIVFDSRGYIVTNAHVVKNFDRIKVVLNNNEQYDAVAEAIISKVDIAVIRITPKRPLPVAPFGSTCDLQLGERVLAVGNPFGYEMTVTQGIVSSVRRDDVIVDENNAYHNVLQTDAAINPGNSGGPLINLDGEVIGINVAIRANAQKIAFTLKIDDVRRELARAIDVEKYKGLTHGLRTTDVKSCESRELLVDGVVPNSPAEVAGFKQYDVVTKVNGLDIVDRVDLERSLFELASGQSCEAIVRRNGEVVKLNLQLAEFVNSPGAATRQITQVVAQDKAWSALGVKLSPVSREALPKKHRHNPENEAGYKGAMRITQVRPGSPAAQAKLAKGDYLVGIGVDKTSSWRIVTPNDVDWVISEGERTATQSLAVYRIRGELIEPVLLTLSLGNTAAKQ